MSEMVPKIRFQGFTDDWEQRKLGDIFSYKQGQQVPIENQFDEPGLNRQRFIRIVDLTTTSEPPRYIEYLGDNRVSPTDLFMIRYGQPGVIGYGYEGVIANNLFRLIPKIETSNLYFKYALNRMYPKIQSLSSSTTMPALNFKSLDVLRIEYPKIQEQRKVGSFFKQLDDLITLHQRKLDLLKEQKKGFLQKMFPKDGQLVPEVRFEGFADDWEQRKLGEVTQLNGRIGFRGYTQEDIISKQDGGILTFSPTNIIDNQLSVKVRNTYITEQKYIESPEIQVENGQILFVKTGSTLGKSALVRNLNERATVNPQVIIIKCDPNFIELLSVILISSSIQKQISKVKIGGAVPTLTETEIKMINVKLPKNTDEQEKIGLFFKQIDDLITLHQHKLDLLKDQKKGYLQKMFV